MINDTIKKIKENISGERAYRNVEGITRYHRIQASQGYRDAANYCLDLLSNGNVDASLFTFPADEKTKYWTQKTFQEWNCKNAVLTLITPENQLLADYQADNLSIVQRSIFCDFMETPREVVRIEPGTKEEHGEDLEGKIIFISEDPNSYLDWIASKKVFGVITDYMSDVFVRQRNDIYDGKIFLSFSWMNGDTDKKTFAFILTPRLGDKLRKVCLSMDEKYKKGDSRERYPKVRGYIDSEFKDGTMEDVTAVIPGDTKEEILLLAHLCHAKACANDNASGCGGAIEIMKTLHNLIENGELPRPKRSIRMLLVPEVVGTYAYLASHEEDLSLIRAGIDIDMIGRKQEGECGMVGIMGVPDSTPSFVQDLAAYVVEENSRDLATFNIDEYVTPVHTQILNYVGGSDHYILCDPSVGIPCPIMMQWLDNNYHSSADTIDQLDPKVLKKNCSIAASYVYTLANLQVEDIWFIMNKARVRFTEQIAKLKKKYAIHKIEYASLREQIEYRREIAVKETEDYSRFFFGEELADADKVIKKEKEYINAYTNAILQECPFEESRKECEERFNIIPLRTVKGPVTFVGFWSGQEEILQKEYRILRSKYPEFYGINSMNDFILHRVNGKNNILEIARGAAMEGRLYNPEYVYEYLKLLEKTGLVSFPVR